jgi:hypothetical protein
MQTFQPEARSYSGVRLGTPRHGCVREHLAGWSGQNSASTGNATLSRLSLDGGHTWKDLTMP